MPVISEHGGNIYKITSECGLDHIIDFSANINPLGLPAGVRPALNGYEEALLHYPDPDCIKLKEDLAKRHGITSNQILISNGSIELIYLIPQLIKPEQSLILVPGFSELEKACRLSGSRIKRISLPEASGFCIEVADIIAQLEGIRLVSIINPNNPTGVLFPAAELLSLVAACEKRGIWLIIDEAFLDFTGTAGEYNLINKAAESEKLIVLRSLTKFYALAGLRLGYGVANSKVIAKLAMLKPPWSVNQLAQVVGLAALKDNDYPAESRRLISRERQYLWDALSQDTRLKPYPGAANYLLVRLIGSSLNASQLQKRLLTSGYLIRDCTNFVGLDNSFFRLAVRKPEENQGLIRAIRECLS